MKVPNRLFILGAGFSKAVSEHMPLVKDLSHPAGPIARATERLMSVDKLFMWEQLLRDPELLLTSLTQMPWKSAEDLQKDQWLFQRVTASLADFLLECEDKVFHDPIPPWVIAFVNFLHRTKATVVTLNYDTILERVAYHNLTDNSSVIPLGEFYRGPIVNIKSRTGVALWGGPPVSTFRILKLHGSTNWYYPADSAVTSQPVYYVPVTHEWLSPLEDAKIHSDLLADLTPFIVPPVLHKDPYLGLGLVKSIWREFMNAMNAADETYFVGYSLPRTDLVMRLALAPLGAHGKKVYLVNRDTSQGLISNYVEALRSEQNLSTRYLRDDAIRAMLTDLTN